MAPSHMLGKIRRQIIPLLTSPYAILRAFQVIKSEVIIAIFKAWQPGSPHPILGAFHTIKSEGIRAIFKAWQQGSPQPKLGCVLASKAEALHTPSWTRGSE